MVLVGQPQLKALLGRPELVQFAQRISSDFHIPKLTVDEVARYIHHRLTVAGRTEPLFDAAAVHRIAVAANGIPRSINILCDTALIYGFSCEASRITREIVDEVIDDKARYGVFGPADGAPGSVRLDSGSNSSTNVADFPCEADVARALFTSLSDKKK